MQHYGKKLWKCFVFEGSFRGNFLFPACFPCCQQRAASTHPTQPLPVSHRDCHSQEEKENSSGLCGTALIRGFNSGVVDSAVGQYCKICSTAQEGFGGFRLCRLLGHQIKTSRVAFLARIQWTLHCVYEKKNVERREIKIRKHHLLGGSCNLIAGLWRTTGIIINIWLKKARVKNVKCKREV